MINRLFQRRTRKDAFSRRSTDFGDLEKKLVDPSCATPMYLPLNFLKSITGDFSKEQELGRGAFGVVYKGILQDRKTIAVKKLLETHLDDDQFHNEVTYLIGLKHENVVQLLGYCAESRWEATQVSGNYVMAEIRHRLICFEYMNNKSLDVYLSAEHCGLEWHKRFEIIRGICYGLHYLHKECNIIHLDLKPHNILMDDNMVPKIADFGTSRLFGQQQSRIITKNLVGTFGYMAPEYLNKGLISTRSDIFSLGVIIIELITGYRDYPENSEALFEHFIKDVVEKWRIRLEKTSKYTLYSQQVEVCTVIGLRCVDSNPKQRPAAWDIIEMLNATEFENMCSGVNEEPLVGETGWSEFVNVKEKVPQRLPAPAPSVLPYKTANVRDHYGIGNRLGKGLFGTTYKCVRNADGAEYACKSIPKRKLLCRQDYEDVYRKIQIMHHVSDQPDVVRIHGTYEDALFVHIVMELCTGGDLLDRITARGHYSERAAAKLFRKIIGIVDGCHSLGVIHGDFKPENLLFVTNAEDAPLKATDFEFSQFYMPGDKFSYGVVGSPRPYYIAPEVIRKCYGPEADIWSVGVILYILLSGIPPFWAETEEGILDQILHGQLDLKSDPWPSISDSAKDLVSNMLSRDPTKRFRTHEVLCHPWILDDAVAPDKPTDSAVLSRLKHFSTMNMFTKMALKVWRFTYPGRYNAPVWGSWSFFKTCSSEKLASWCAKL